MPMINSMQKKRSDGNEKCTSKSGLLPSRATEVPRCWPGRMFVLSREALPAWRQRSPLRAASAWSVLMVEKYGFCGGATVAGLSGTICGLFSSGSYPEQIVFGFAAEFHDRMARRGGVGKPLAIWKDTACTATRVSSGKRLPIVCYGQQQVRILYHTHFLRAFQQENRIDALLVQAKEGQAVIQPKVVVDASGDAEVVHSLSGATTLGRKGVVQTPTMIFRMGGVDIEAFLKLDPAEIDRKIVEASQIGSVLPSTPPRVPVSHAEWSRRCFVT